MFALQAIADIVGRKKYKSLQAKEDAAATEKLMQSMAVQREAKDARRPPILSMQESRKLPLPKPIKPGASTSHWSAQPRDREKKTFLQKARREVAAETKRFRLPTATGKLPVAAGQITKAPAAMLAEARIRNQPLSGTNRMLAPRKLGPSRPHDEAEERRRRENEARLQRIKNPAGSKTATPNLVSFSSEESDESHDETGPSHSRAASKQSAKRRGGFLSAAPGANPAGQRVPVRPSEQDNDLFGDMEFDDSRPASNKQPTKRHHGAPGTSSAGHQFPTRRKSPTHTSPPPPDLSRGPAASPHSTSTMPNMAAVMQRKRKPVDVFMRPDKKPRR